MSQHWGIIGGGMLGMTIAHRLSQAGEQVTLLEAADHLGGLADAWQLGNVTWDRHYHVTLLSDLAFRELLKELQLDKDMQWVETKTGFYTDGQLYSMSNTVEFLKFPPLALIDKIRLGGTIFYASKVKNWKKLEQIPVADWLRKLSGMRAFEKMWLPLLRAKLGENYKKTSAAFIWSTIARMYSARRSGLKKEMFGYLPGGYARILKHFAGKLEAEGVQIQLSSPVQQVKSQAGSGVELTLQDGRVEHFDQVVLTCPAPVISRICPDLTPEEQEQHQRISYQGIVCASVLLKQPLDRFYVTNITEPWVPFTAVIEMSALVDREEFGGNSLIYLPKYVMPNDPMFEESDESIQERFITALEQMYPHFERSQVLAFQVSRVRNVVALSTLNYSAHLPPMTTSQPGIFAVNSAQIVNGTLNVNETVRLANQAVEQLLLPMTHASAEEPYHAQAHREFVARS